MRFAQTKALPNAPPVVRADEQSQRTVAIYSELKTGNRRGWPVYTRRDHLILILTEISVGQLTENAADGSIVR